MPTTLELASAEKPEHVQFTSLLPLIKEERSTQYEAMYGAYRHLQRMVRKENYKLIYYPAIDKKLLFNLKNDPKEMQNLADRDEFKTIISDLWDTMQALQAETGDTLNLTLSGKE